MKVLIYGDPHWSQYSSIVRKRGEKYSVRLENLIQSMNWAMRLAEEEHCWATVCLGDFFDKAELNSEEISALKEIDWACMTNYFIAGNHEMGAVDHRYTSVDTFRLLDTGDVITTPQRFRLQDTEFCILPYILEEDRKPLSEYFPEPLRDRFGLPCERIILSHNDIKGIQMGNFISQEGFSIEEIQENCDWYINGHLHNGCKVADKIINCGNLTGQNFGEDAMRYEHGAIIIDTDQKREEEVAFYTNPYAFNFYKLDVTKWVELGTLQIKPNAVCTIKCRERDAQTVREWVEATPNIIESRLIIEPEKDKAVDIAPEELTVDHLEQFRQYILETLGNTEVVAEELAEVVR